MLYDYSPFWNTIKELDITTYQLINRGVNKRTIHKLRHGEVLTILTLAQLCCIIKVPIERVVKINIDQMI